ncbi:MULTISPECIES: flagellar motor stator protein MotA [Thioalkalivibrio]|uniref:Flagellar motor protein MotA n=1 Tax=Thioalkalivibrio versutus TaxID=106634 RepID=A0A0G3G366_9GAMM|nr:MULTISPECIES: flagellar motor stator protein MotA [Thioalkalivibrio]AKJ95620.1 flagellar motor protein MotA [Thioalkalivibrio versutus]OOC47964.1 flagellar motor stator protein MotA [Thioalkalivibrio versutus]
MKYILGFIIVLGGVFGGFMLHGGNIMVIWQPYEYMIIGGAALGAFLIANPLRVVITVMKSLPQLLKGGAKYSRDDYLDLLALMYKLFTKARKEGLMGIEGDVEEPEESALFQAHPRVLKDHHAVEFITDYMRLIISGSMNPHELDALMDVDLETHHEESERPSHAVNRVADALPGFGIVAAVLGIVNTMGAIGGSIEEIGMSVAAALVGSFLGILLAYGFVGPTAAALESRSQEEAKFLQCIKACILANVQGYSPQVAVEFGRKTMESEMRPGFAELEEHVKAA